MAAQAGIEPASAFLQVAVSALTCESAPMAGAQGGAQIVRELAEVVRAWQSLPAQIRFAVVGSTWRSTGVHEVTTRRRRVSLGER
jgi:hypothetical protein